MEGFHSGAPNLCRVCVDAWAGGEATGRLYHCYSKQPEPIGRTSDVLDSIDRLCDRLNYPARTQQPRRFGPQKPRPQPQTPQKKVEPQMTRDELAEQKGKMATFVVHAFHLAGQRDLGRNGRKSEFPQCAGADQADGQRRG